MAGSAAAPKPETRPAKVHGHIVTLDGVAALAATRC